MDSYVSIIIILFCSLHLFFFFFKPLSDILFKEKVKTGQVIGIQIGFELILILLTFLGWTNAYSIMIICIFSGIPLSIISSLIVANKRSKEVYGPPAEIVSVKTVLINCPKCGYETNNANERCPKCGQIIIKKTYCPSCDSEVDEKNKFCPKCGKKLKMDKEFKEYESEFKVCGKCSATQTKKEAMYCRKCGNKL